MSANEQGTTAEKKVKAGALDVRVIIGGLLGIFGAVLFVTGLVNGSGSGAPPHADPDHLNLYVGIALLVAAIFFIGWSRLRPLLVPVEEGTVEAKRAGGH
jgi:hypothetical protein